MSISFAAAVALSAAAPTYLTCYIEQDGERLPVEIAADEDNRRATVSLKTGRIVERLAQFTPAELRIVDQQSLWVVDRADLDFQRVVTIGDHQSTNYGKCAMKPAPAERAF